MSFVKLRGGDDDNEKKRPELSPTSGSGQSIGGQPGSTAISNVGSTGRTEAYLGQGSKIAGILNFTGPVEIDGVVEGEIIAKESLTIGKSAQINARVSGTEILVLGTVTGDITASRRLVLKKPAKITGNINCANLSIEEGVVFEGKCVMNGATVGGEVRQGKAVDSK